MKLIDLIGRKFGRLYVLERAENDKQNKPTWLCKCDCGSIKIFSGCHLRSGATKSCGCLHIEIIIKNQTGRSCSIKTRKRISNGNKGKCRSVDQKKKLSTLRSGDKHPRWNPNLTDEDRQDRRLVPGLEKWRCSVYERDNYTCQICGKDGGLNAHHLNGWNLFPEQQLIVSNGITLCISCHKEFHNQYGRGNNTIEQWKEFTNAK